MPLPPPIQNPPPLSNQEKAESEIRFSHIDYVGRTLKSHDWCRLALLLIKARKWDEAWGVLNHSIDLDEEFDFHISEIEFERRPGDRQALDVYPRPVPLRRIIEESGLN